MVNTDNSAIILLSGGLDSVVSIVTSNAEIKLGVIFDYGQNSFEREKIAAKNIADYYKFPLKIITLDWLKEVVDNGLTSKDKLNSISDLQDENELINSMQSVWVPNRNALFINIAAALCEAKGIKKIIIGANNEEAKTFRDNSKEFIEKCNASLKMSTNSEVEVVAPLINMNKNDIVKEGINYSIPFEYIYSCYLGEEKHCGSCESCLHLKRALLYNNRQDLIKKLF